MYAALNLAFPARATRGINSQLMLAIDNDCPAIKAFLRYVASNGLLASKPVAASTFLFVWNPIWTKPAPFKKLLGFG